jgi:hypothetical protein
VTRADGCDSGVCQWCDSSDNVHTDSGDSDSSE